MGKFHLFCEKNMLTITCLTQKICLKECPWKVERFVQKEDGLCQMGKIQEGWNQYTTLTIFFWYKNLIIIDPKHYSETLEHALEKEMKRRLCWWLTFQLCTRNFFLPPSSSLDFSSLLSPLFLTKKWVWVSVLCVCLQAREGVVYIGKFWCKRT